MLTQMVQPAIVPERSEAVEPNEPSVVGKRTNGATCYVHTDYAAAGFVGGDKTHTRNSTTRNKPMAEEEREQSIVRCALRALSEMGWAENGFSI